MLADKLRAALDPGRSAADGGKGRDPRQAGKPADADTSDGGAGGGGPAEGPANSNGGNGGKQED